MVAPEPPSPAPPPPLSPAQSAFLAAYVEARNDIRITAQKLQVPLENALTQFADPAFQVHLALLDESQKRAARVTAIATIHQAIAGLNRALEYKGDPSHTAKASGHLARAALWLVRIAEGKVGPDTLPSRYRRNDPDRPPRSPEPASEADRLQQTLKALARLRARAPEILADRPTPQPPEPRPAREGSPAPATSVAERPTREPNASVATPSARPVPDSSASGLGLSPPSGTPGVSPASLFNRAGMADTS